LAERGAQILDEVNVVSSRWYHNCSTILDDLDRGNKSGTESMIQNSISVAQGHYFGCKLRSDTTRILNGLVLSHKEWLQPVHLYRRGRHSFAVVDLARERQLKSS
jgi:hypothetical protein